ncbi:FmdB family zinc ribbon protein [Candidatus Poriferisodalis sp.]|uniref:FmdB family zinc ribbon protein n=1 Tax=Candidatus Poriferisodalis sp. TaxID=3101277 RepID=UPI003B017C27
MPTYQYRCTDCGQSFERYQSFSDDPITVCPLPRDSEVVNGTDNGSASTCGGEVRKIFSNVGISFKGSGFYRNDSRSQSRAKSASSDSSASDTSPSETSGSGTSASSTGSESSSDSASKKSASSDSGSTNDSSSSTVGAASASG